MKPYSFCLLTALLIDFVPSKVPPASLVEEVGASDTVLWSETRRCVHSKCHCMTSLSALVHQALDYGRKEDLCDRVVATSERMLICYDSQGMLKSKNPSLWTFKIGFGQVCFLSDISGYFLISLHWQASRFHKVITALWCSVLEAEYIVSVKIASAYLVRHFSGTTSSLPCRLYVSVNQWDGGSDLN